MPYIVEYSASEGTNLSYSATIAVAATVGETRSFIDFFFFRYLIYKLGYY